MSECYVALKACGCCVAAIVDNPERRQDTAKEVASWLRDGLTVERKSVEWVRETMRDCPHKPKGVINAELPL